ncbi:MAG: hypothetical protein I8H98_03980 [Moraxellaceae bacterium]|nr:hypothetical protein [Moraxellaceae bacterium]MBH2030325.1 hypothetical protein [Moraxellaceae bacterium]
MEGIKRLVFKGLKWVLVIVLAFILLLGIIELIADKFFDNAAMKDSCADSGGAWNKSQSKCQYAPTDPRNKN